MKNALVFLLGSCLIAGAIVYVCRPKPVPVNVTVASPANDSPAPPAPASIVTTAPQSATPAPDLSVAPVPAVNTNIAAPPAKSDAEIAFGKMIDALLDPHISGPAKHDLFQQLAKAGQLNQAIEELKQRAAADPTNPEIPTTLGEAQLNELRELKDSGADVNELGILAMQADQSFNAALKIDPSNYEAQLVKSISMTYWPVDPTRDAQVVQTLSSLIDQQENMTPNPGFSQTYIYLGNEYQKIGQNDKAIATWQLGLQKFPTDPTLQQKVNGQ
jgi:tetratricopeptide (TPR) repeat protein